MSYFVSFSEKVYRICAFFAAICVFIMMFWGAAGIASRLLFNYSIPALYEASSLLLVLAVYLGVPITQHEFGNVRMEFLIARIKERNRGLIEAIGLFLSLIVSGLIFWRTMREAVISISTGEYQMGIFSFPVWPSRMAIAVGFLMLCVCLATQFVQMIRKVIRQGKERS